MRPARAPRAARPPASRPCNPDAARGLQSAAGRSRLERAVQCCPGGCRAGAARRSNIENQRRRAANPENRATRLASARESAAAVQRRGRPDAELCRRLAAAAYSAAFGGGGGPDADAAPGLDWDRRPAHRAAGPAAAAALRPLAAPAPAPLFAPLSPLPAADEPCPAVDADE